VGTLAANDSYVVYGAQGSGSVPIEAALSLLGQPYRIEECAPWVSRERAAELAPVNPMLQVPALALPSGELMTESAAILIWLADVHPEARLSPAMDHDARPAYLRWMNFVSSAIYALYWIRDNPLRITDRIGDHAAIKARLADRISHCWGVMGTQVSPGRYLLGDDLSVLDLYVATASRWSPGRQRFYEVAPGLAEAIRRVDAHPRLAELWAERFPFVEGWDG
jgi:GST-like protein